MFRRDFRHFSLPPISRSAGWVSDAGMKGKTETPVFGHGELQVEIRVLVADRPIRTIKIVSIRSKKTNHTI